MHVTKVIPQGVPVAGERPRTRSPVTAQRSYSPTQSTVQILYEGFEGIFPGPWAVWDNNGSTGGEVYWDDTSYRSDAGSWSVWCADGGPDASPPGGDYSNDMDSWLAYGPFDLSDAASATLSFRYWLDTEPGFDFLYWTASADGISYSGVGTDADTVGWESMSLDLADHVGDPTVWIAFIFQSDMSVTYEGAYIDEVVIEKTVGGGDPDARVEPLTLDFQAPGTTATAENGAESRRADRGASPRLLRLRFGDVDMSTVGMDATTLDAIRGQSEAHEREHFLFQFNDFLSRAEKEALREKGIRVLQYIPDYTYWVAIESSAKGVSTLREGGGVRWAWKPPASYRTSPAIARGQFPPNARFDDGTVLVYVRVFEDVDEGEVLARMSAVAGVIVQSRVFQGVFSVRLALDRIEVLASLDEVEWVEPAPPPRQRHNLTAAQRIHADVLWDPPYSLHGSGVAVGIWDEGRADAHNDYAARLTVQDPTAAVNAHSTHVTGTVGGSGAGNASAHGMAAQVALHTWDWDEDLDEMRNEGPALGIDISNHSYGARCGWWWNSDTNEWEDYGASCFGLYNTGTAALDDVVFDTGLIVFKSAGNDRNDGPDWPGGPRMDGPYDTVTIIGNAKNIITVCATTDTDAMTAFSGWGPSDDGRIKPDLCANGYGLWSTVPGNAYASFSGTSMASPSAAGGAALLHQLFEAETGTAPDPATLKALLLHGCEDLGRTGPDYVFGWGLLDAEASADLILARAWRNDVIDTTGHEQTFSIEIPPGASELKVTLVWTDPQGSPVATQALVNDLDLTLGSPGGTTWQPWVLDGGNPSAPATRGTNNLDNVEQVLVDFPEPGTWTVRVLGAAIPDGPQEFSIVAEGIGDDTDSQPFTVHNDGTGILTVSSLATDQPASWISWSPPAPFDVAPGQSRAVHVSVDFASAPLGVTTRRILVESNDPDESPYPGGVFVNVSNGTSYMLSILLAGDGTGVVTSDPSGIDCGGDCDQAFGEGEVVLLFTDPTGGSTFAGWSGDADCEDGTVTMTTDVSCTATFSTSSCTLTTGPSPVQGGRTLGDGTFACGTQVSVAALENTGFEFVNWTLSDVPVSNDAEYIFTLDTDTDLVANFTQQGAQAMISLPDINDNGSAEIAVLYRDPATGRSRVYVKDGGTAATIRAISLFGPNYVSVGLVRLSHFADSDAPEIAVAGMNVNTGQVVVRIHDALTGTRANEINFSENYPPRALHAIESFGDTAADEIALLGVNPADDRILIRIKDASSGAKLNDVRYPSTFEVVAMEIAPDHGGTTAPEIALLGYKPATGTLLVRVKDASSGEKLNDVYFSLNYIPLAFAVVPDFAGTVGAPELAVLGVNDSGTRVLVRMKDAASGSKVGDVFFSANYAPWAFEVVPDSAGTTAPELAVAGVHITTGQVMTRIKDAETGAKLNDIPSSANYPPELIAAVEGLGGSSAPELLILGTHVANGNVLVRCKDASTSATVATIPIP